MHLFLRQVGEQHRTRGMLNHGGIQPKPWTAEEEHFAQMAEEDQQALAEQYESMEAKGWK